MTDEAVSDDMNSLNVAAYFRVSTEDQNFEPQKIEVEKFCAARGWHLVRELGDVMSGSKFNRPGLDKLMAMVRQKEIAAVVVAKMDRLGRSLIETAALVQEMTEAGVAFIATSQNIDTSNSNPAGKFMMQMLMACAEFERELIRERTRAGIAAARKRGSVIGHKSTKLVPNWPEVLEDWTGQGKPGSFRGLAALLGGVSVDTAWKIATGRHKPAIAA